MTDDPKPGVDSNADTAMAPTERHLAVDGVRFTPGDHVEAAFGEDPRIEGSLHGEGRADETKATGAALFRVMARGFDDTYQGNGRALPDFLEHEVGRVRCECGDFGAGFRQSRDFESEIGDQLVEFARAHQSEHLRKIDAVDDEPRVTAIPNA